VRKGGTSLTQRPTEAINEIKRAAIAADLGIKAHAHMLRHACGYKLANDGLKEKLLHGPPLSPRRHSALW
jgi:integrase